MCLALFDSDAIQPITGASGRAGYNYSDRYSSGDEAKMNLYYAEHTAEQERAIVVCDGTRASTALNMLLRQACISAELACFSYPQW